MNEAMLRAQSVMTLSITSHIPAETVAASVQGINTKDSSAANFLDKMVVDDYLCE